MKGFGSQWWWLGLAVVGGLLHWGEHFVFTALIMSTIWAVGGRIVSELRKP